MSARPPGRLVLIACVAALAGALLAPPARAQEAAAPATPAAAPEWTFDAAALYYFLPDDQNYVQPMLVARRGALHLEARYNYEDRDTASLFGGWAFGGGTEFEWELVPMLGAAFGDTDGIVPACTVSLAWKELSVYSEIEYLADLADRESNFFYAWSEITWDPTDSFGAGMVVQRTRVYESERDTQRGVMAHFSKGAWTGAVYWFNPGSDDDFVAVSVGAGF